ncbi:MAG: hypothetical protein ACTSQA_06050 [Candidatus Heimdallarchaeaceae archaeon]
MNKKTNEELISIVAYLKEEMELPDFSFFGDDNRPYKVLIGDIVKTLETILEVRLENSEYFPEKDKDLPRYRLVTAVNTKMWSDGFDIVFEDENGEEYPANGLIDEGW